MYRFGDGTPFPLRENFIDTIVSAVDSCVALYHLEMEVEERHRRVREARKLAADELKRLDALKALIETAVAPLATRKDRAQRASEAAATRIFESAQSIIRQSRESVVKQRDTVVQEGTAATRNEAVLAALATFFRSHTLPRTEWRLRWQAAPDTPPVAELGAQPTRELELSFAPDILADSSWAAPQPTTELVPGLSVPAVLHTGKGRRRTVRLESFELVEVHISPGREAFVLRESARRPTSLHVVMPRGSDTAPLVVALDRHDQPIGQPFYLDETASAALHAIWSAVDARLPDLLAARGAPTSGRLGGRDVTILDHPGQLAEAILMSLAPLIREMRMRSRVPGELILKRDLAGDRREEMFVPRKVLWAKLESLPAHHRQIFEAIGLGNEATLEFVTRIQTQPGTARPSRVPLTAHGTGPGEAVGASADAFERDPVPLGPAVAPPFDDEATRPKTDRPARPTEISGVIEALRASA